MRRGGLLACPDGSAYITKQDRNWLVNKLDASKRSQIFFMGREDILNLFVVTNLPLPSAGWPVRRVVDEPPF